MALRCNPIPRVPGAFTPPLRRRTNTALTLHKRSKGSQETLPDGASPTETLTIDFDDRCEILKGRGCVEFVELGFRSEGRFGSDQGVSSTTSPERWTTGAPRACPMRWHGRSGAGSSS